MYGKIDVLGRRDSNTRGIKYEFTAEIGVKRLWLEFSDSEEEYHLENGNLFSGTDHDTVFLLRQPKKNKMIQGFYLDEHIQVKLALLLVLTNRMKWYLPF